MATLALRRGDPVAAAHRLAMADDTLHDAAGKFRMGLVETRILLANGSELAGERIAELARIAKAQGSRLEELLVVVLRGLRDDRVDSAIGLLLPEETHLLSVLAEEVSRGMARMGDEARERVWREAHLRPDRWVSALRLNYLADPIAAKLLCEIGTEEDAAAMRTAASSRKWLRPLAAQITRRLAPQVLLRDLGPVGIVIGGHEQRRALRRKVLGLLCFVTSRPGMACTRDEALDAIWPDLSPDTAVNSLHQTIYYLRRVFEPTYREGVSAGYLQFDGEVLTLDRTLVDAESRRCWRLVERARRGELAAVDELVAAYRGTYALDFAYEDWATELPREPTRSGSRCGGGGCQGSLTGRRCGAGSGARTTGLGHRPRGRRHRA